MNARIKLTAKDALSRAHTSTVPVVAAMMLFIMLFSVCNYAVNRFLPYYGSIFLLIFAAISLIISVLAIAPLRLRFQIKHLLISRGIKSSQRLNIGIRGIFRACLLSVCLFFIKLFWFAVFEAVPLIFSAVFVMVNFRNAVSLRASFIFFSGMIILFIAGLGFYFFHTQKYAKSMFYLACYKDFTAIQAIRESVRKTQNRCADILYFKLGFFPWFLLCVLIFPVFYVVPYYKQSVTCFYLSR